MNAETNVRRKNNPFKVLIPLIIIMAGLIYAPIAMNSISNMIFSVDYPITFWRYCFWGFIFWDWLLPKIPNFE